MKRFSDTLAFSGDIWRYVLTMYNIFGTGKDIKKYLHRTVDPSTATFQSRLYVVYFVLKMYLYDGFFSRS